LETALKLLFDTHVWIWAVQEPERIPRSVKRVITNVSNQLYLSPISIWEACHLHTRGRLRTKQTFPVWLEAGFAASPIHEAPFSFAVATEAARITLPQPDPGDVFLAATAVALDLTLITADEQFLECSWLKTIDCRA